MGKLNSKTNFLRGVMFNNHNKIVEYSNSEVDANRIFYQEGYNSVYQMLGRWVQNRTNDFNASVTGDSD